MTDGRFIRATIAEVRPDTDSAIRVRLALPPSDRPRFAFRPGQHVTLRRVVDGEELRRTYSLCSSPDEADLSVTIKRLPGGRFSGHACDTFRAGQSIDLLPPSGSFVLPPCDDRPRLCVGLAAGSGITPIYAMLRHLLEHEPHGRFVLLYGNRDARAILLREALADLKDRHVERLTVTHLLSRSDEDDGAPLSGRIDRERVVRWLPRVVAPGSVDHAFVCGPGSMIRAAADGLAELGIARERIHSERFHPEDAPPSWRPDEPEARAGAPVELVVKLDGIRHTVAMRPGQTVIDAALQAGVGVPYSCRAGMCCTCRGRLLEGEVAMAANYSLEASEIERGFVLTCQARASSGRVVIDYDPA
jgi:ring-1,2-phenylacetyl-CoA epoxidase subunit PaaE